MTEIETDWHSCNDPTVMLQSIQGMASVRKFRLCAVACCRRIDFLLIATKLARGAVNLAERMADRPIVFSPKLSEFRAWVWWNGFMWIDGYRNERLNNAYAYAVWAVMDALQNEDVFLGKVHRGQYDMDWLTEAAGNVAWAVAHWRRRDDEEPVNEEEQRRELAEQVPLVHDVFGNPFCPAPTVDPAWLSWQNGVVGKLARAAYDERRLPEGTLDPVRLAVLADALEDAGCADAELLGHLRGPGPHVRGCWAVDLVLANE